MLAPAAQLDFHVNSPVFQVQQFTGEFCIYFAAVTPMYGCVCAYDTTSVLQSIRFEVPNVEIETLCQRACSCPQLRGGPEQRDFIASYLHGAISPTCAFPPISHLQSRKWELGSIDENERNVFETPQNGPVFVPTIRHHQNDPTDPPIWCWHQHQTKMLVCHLCFREARQFAWPKTVEDRQAGMQCLSKYGYGVDGPLHEEGRGGVALAWKTSKWTLQSMEFLSPRALKASLSSGPLEITLVATHFHHKHTRRQSQWKDIAKELHGPNLILCADHNSLVVKHRDAFAPPEFEHDTSLRAREQEVTALARAGLQDVWVEIHCPTLTDIKDKESSCPTGFTYGYPREGERLDPQRLRRIDRIHTTPYLLSLATSVYPMFAANSDHKAILAEFTPPSFETEDTIPRFYCPETILQDSEAMEDLETSLKSITSTGDQWWEDALGCIQTKAVSYQREHKNKKQSVELHALRLLRGSTRDSVTLAVYQFLSSLGIAATEAATAYTLLVGVYEKAQRDRTGMETLSKLKGVITSGETSGDLRTRKKRVVLANAGAAGAKGTSAAGVPGRHNNRRSKGGGQRAGGTLGSSVHPNGSHGGRMCGLSESIRSGTAAAQGRSTPVQVAFSGHST